MWDRTRERASSDLYDKLMSNYDAIPPGVSQPLVKPRSIDDVPILSFTLWSPRYHGYDLRRVALGMVDQLKKDPDVGEVRVIGGQRRQVRVTFDPSRLRAYAISPLQIVGAFRKSNVLLPSGDFPSNNGQYLVDTGGFLSRPEEIGELVVSVFNDRPVYLKDVASISDGPEEPANYVFMGIPGNGALRQSPFPKGRAARGLRRPSPYRSRRRRGPTRPTLPTEPLKKSRP